MRIEFVIDELALIGFDPRDRFRIADAVETQLAAQASNVSASRIIEHSQKTRTTLRGTDIKLSTSRGRADANEIGEGVARSIVNAVGAAPSSARKR